MAITIFIKIKYDYCYTIWALLHGLLRMTRLRKKDPANGFFGIGIVNSFDAFNIGTLWRSAYILGASFIFTIDKRYKKQSSDVSKAWSKIPLYHYKDLDGLLDNLPYDTRLIGIEMDEKSVPLADYEHPSRCIYLLGSEQNGLSPQMLERCHGVVSLPGKFSLNVAVTGSIVMYDRCSKRGVSE